MHCKSERPPFCFVENTITEHDQAHFSARAEISMRLHKVCIVMYCKSKRPPFCFVENTITEHDQAHFSARAEISMQLHEVFVNFSSG